jgi:hypothetical protein
MKKPLIMIASLLFIGAAQAQINFDQVTHRGTGCPTGTVSTAVSPDGSTLSILFDEFRVEVPQFDQNNDNGELRHPRAQRNNPLLSHKNCNLSFTAHLPPGTTAESLEVSVQARGATMLEAGVQGYFASILVGYEGLASSRGRPTVLVTKNWRNPRMANGVDEDWTATPKAVVPLHSACAGAQGRSIRFDLKNHINAEIVSGDVSRSGLISVDSADVSGMLKFTLRTRRCGGNLPPRRI